VDVYLVVFGSERHTRGHFNWRATSRATETTECGVGEDRGRVRASRAHARGVHGCACGASKLPRRDAGARIRWGMLRETGLFGVLVRRSSAIRKRRGVASRTVI